MRTPHLAAAMVAVLGCFTTTIARADEGAERESGQSHTAAQVLLWSAAATSLVGAVGHTLTSVPAVHDHYAANETDAYWRNRLTATQTLAATTLYMTALTAGLAAYLSGFSDPKVHRAGTYVTLASIVPHVLSGIVVPLLTPRDSWHTAFHWTPAAMMGTALALDW